LVNKQQLPALEFHSTKASLDNRTDVSHGNGDETANEVSPWIAELNGIISAGQDVEGEQAEDDDDPDYGRGRSKKVKKCQICGFGEYAETGMQQHIRSAHADWISADSAGAADILWHRYWRQISLISSQNYG
jgi:hypothetical protein